MTIASSLPRVSLAQLPTPVHPLPRLSAALGIELSVKRDDQTGLALGGNKARKLELLVGQALAEGADTLITGGAAQSNHCRQTAAAAARCGLRCVLVLAGAAQPPRTGNLLLDELLGAELVFAGERERDAVMAEVEEHERASGRRPFLIPYGGSSGVGATAYALALEELAGQGLAAAFDRVVFATSSGGTQAGLLLGAALLGFRGALHGVSVDLAAPELAARVAALAGEAAAGLGLERRFTAGEVRVDDRFRGAGYGVCGDAERDAIRRFARLEGLLLDPVYTGRAAAGLLALAASGELARGERVLFWHTGGAPALWAYADDLVG